MTDFEEVFLGTGDFYFGSGRVRLRTLLGSCVTVTLWHPRHGLGGMCHFMLPSRPRLPSKALDGHYGEEAFMLFDEALAKHGTRANQYEAKLFGGGNMFSHTEKGISSDIGGQNIRLARRLLHERGVNLIAEHVGGAGHRKLYFDLWSGEVWLSFQSIQQAVAYG